MGDRDVFGMNDEQSNSWYSSLEDVENEVESIVNLDPKKRKLIWSDGSKLSFDESVERIQVRHPSHSQDLIHTHLQGWLEQGELPSGLSDEQLEQLDTLVSEWAEQIPTRLTRPMD